MAPDFGGAQEVLDEYGLTIELLDSSQPLALLSSLAAATDGGADLLAAADRAIGTARSSHCLYAIVIDYAGADLGTLGYPVDYDRSAGPVFDVLPTLT